MKMQKLKYVFYQDGALFIGWLKDYPEYKTQGHSIEELMENVDEIFEEIVGGKVLVGR